MPADYSSAARALSLPISPLPSPSPENQNNRPAWVRRTSSRRTPYSQHSSSQLSLKDQLLRSADKLQRRALSTYAKLTPLQKALGFAAAIISLTFGILFLIYNESIFGALAPAAQKWREIPGGFMILWALTFVSAFPPIIGYSTTVTISGFVYGFPNGWFIVASATVFGSLASFITSRTIFSKYVHRLVGADKRFEALALTLKHDGLKILCMIRFCPLPYSLSNAAMSTFPTVHPLTFALATALASPKLLIHVFIGSRMAALGSGESLDTSAKIVNWASIIIGGILGVVVGYIIYQKTISRAAELEAEELEAGRRNGSGSEGARRYDDNEDVDVSGRTVEEDVAALMDGDDISLWDNDEGPLPGYHDEFNDGGSSDEDRDVFARGDRSDRNSSAGKGGNGIRL